jgi:chloramphenicol-sensitive protein RarD
MYFLKERSRRLTDDGGFRTLLALSLPASPDSTTARQGAAAALLAYFLWGTLPVYWKMLEGIPVVELMAHRIVWTLAAVVVFQLARGRWGALRATWGVPANRRAHFQGGVFLTLNWGIFVWALLHDQLIEASLGYFLVPLVSAALGRVLFKERLERLQKIALWLAGLGVAILFLQIENPPWVAAGIVTSWCCYGVGRKRSDASAINGLGLELVFVLPAAVLYLGWLQVQGGTSFGAISARTDLTIMGTGIISMVPLVLFAFATRRLTYTTLGLLQYVAPTCQFLMGWIVFGEPFAGVRVFGFGLIWLGIACYATGTIRRRSAVTS